MSMPCCQTCGKFQFESNDVVWERDYYWHRECYVENSFPANGKIMPDSILTGDHLPKKRVRKKVKEKGEKKG